MARVYRSAHGATTISRPASRLNCPRHPAPRVATSRMGGVPRHSRETALRSSGWLCGAACRPGPRALQLGVDVLDDFHEHQRPGERAVDEVTNLESRLGSSPVARDCDQSS